MLKIAIYLQTLHRGPVTFPMTKKVEKAGISHLHLKSPQTLRPAIFCGILTVFVVSTSAVPRRAGPMCPAAFALKCARMVVVNVWV